MITYMNVGSKLVSHGNLAIWEHIHDGTSLYRVHGRGRAREASARVVLNARRHALRGQARNVVRCLVTVILVETQGVDQAPTCVVK